MYFGFLDDTSNVKRRRLLIWGGVSFKNISGI